MSRRRLSFPSASRCCLNLASASNSEDREVLWGFIRRYAPDATPEAHPLLDQLVGYAIRYFHDFVKPNKHYRAPISERARGAARSRRAARQVAERRARRGDSEPRSMRSARSTASSRCATGSLRSTRFFSVRRKAPVSALLSSSMALPRPARSSPRRSRASSSRRVDGPECRRGSRFLA